MILDKKDCCFERDGERFRYRVGAIIVEGNHVLLATSNDCGYFYSVGGGVHLGELAEDAIVREVKEETGVDYEVERLAAIHENFFIDSSKFLKGLRSHEISFYYLMKPRGARDCSEFNMTEVGKEYMKWLPIDKLREHKVFPTFLADYLESRPQGVAHYTTRE